MVGPLVRGPASGAVPATVASRVAGRPGSASRAALLLPLACVAIACRSEVDAPAAALRVRVEPTAGAPVVQPGEDLQARIDAAGEGTTLCLADGRHAGPIVVKKRLALQGGKGAVIAGTAGTTVRLEANGSSVRGLTIAGSGTRFDLLDSALCVHADDVLVEGIGIEDALFGILVEKAARVTLRGNEVRGTGEAAMGLRGDTIRLWETSDCKIERNLVHDGRDMVVWYSKGTSLTGNEVCRGRYGTHFMYSRDCGVAGNRYLENVVGVFAMYSHGLRLAGNTIARCSGSAGIGIGVKESGGLAITGNVVAANTTALFVDTSPLDPDERNLIESNELRMSQTAILFHGGSARNRFAGNRLADNAFQVRVDGGGDARAAEWDGNSWDDYRGYDLDGDGIGDLPYEARSLSAQLTSKHEDLAFFRGTPMLGLLDLAAEIMPMFRPRVLLEDPRPRTELREVAGAR